MAIRINANIAALNAQRRLGESTSQLSQAYVRLSSGLRINRAADDAAGLAIASGLNADARVYGQGVRNINDALSVLDVAESALGELSNIVGRQIELAQQSANGVLTITQRKSLDSEFKSLTREYNRIIESTSFNGTKLLEQPSVGYQVQAGYGASEGISFTLNGELARPVSNGNYTNAASLLGGSRGQDILAADFNGDGHLDTAMAQEAMDAVTINLGAGNGQFSNPVSFQTGDQPWGIEAGDVNSDGKIDLVTIDLTGSSYSILYGNGNGTFKAAASYAITGGAPENAQLVDVNRDGRLDLVTSGSASGNIGIFLGLAGGGFGAQSTIASGYSGTADLAVADMNADGNMDIAVGGPTSVAILLGTGTGSFGSARTYQVDGSPSTLAFGDFNGDDYLDLAVGQGGINKTSILLGNADGSFSKSSSFGGSIAGIAQIFVDDLNGDGLDDYIYNDVGGSVALYYGNGNGTFSAGMTFVSPTFPTAVVIADFDENGVVDFATSNHNGPGGGYIYLSGETETTHLPLLSIKTQADALEALTFSRQSLDRIIRERGNVGAIQSRFAVAASVLEQRRQNYVTASSGIMDADVAVEAAQLVRAKILQQAGAAVLAQANQTPALALKLLDI